MIDLNKVLQGFPCDDCSLVSSDYKQFLSHRIYHTRLFRSKVAEETLLEESCPVCFVKYIEKYKDNSLEDLLGSGKIELENSEPRSKLVIRCKYYPECNEEFYQFSKFNKHAKEVHNDDSPYACQHCNYTTGRYDSLKRHVLAHVGFKKYSCHLCPKQYAGRDGLQDHLLSFHNEVNIKAHDCSYCSKKFSTPYNLKRHLITHFLNSSKCRLCSKEFPSQNDLKRHLRTHKGIDVQWHECSHCEKVYSTRGDLNRHLTLHFPLLPKCDLCFKEFSSKSYLKKHLKSQHLNIREIFKCHLCPKEYRKRHSLKLHVLGHNDVNVKSHDCICCGKKYSKLDDLKAHLRIHFPTPETLKCHLCSKQLFFKSRLIEHLKRHYKMFKCHLCTKKYGAKESLNIHLFSRHKEVEVKSHDCSYCDNRFPTSFKLKCHLRKHFPPAETFKCRQCSKEYFSRERLEIHIISHHKEPAQRLDKKAYVCKECGRQYTLKSSLRRHLDPVKESKKMLSCPKCPKVFKNINCFTHHERSHRELMCKVCNRKYFSRSGYREHLKVHETGSDADSCSKTIPEKSRSSEKPFKCSTCAQTFRRKRALKDHSREHERRMSCVCKFCKKELRSQKFLQLHHNPEKETKNPLCCKECPEAFSNINCFNHHKRSHMEQFTCEVCKAKCLSRLGFKKHLAKHGIE